MMATLVSLTLVLPVDSFSGYSSKVVPLSPVNHFFHYPFHLAASGGEEMEKFENARQEFEKLIVSSKPLHSSMTQISTQNVKPLTASTKRFMELELNLLKQLEESDDVVDPLVELWTAERADASKDLRQMELGNCSPGLVREEAQLRAMIEQYGTEWVEPMNRLAVLLFTKGRLMEAMDLIRNVLQVKPWHFEAGQLLVVMLLRMGDYNSAVKAARTYTLPNLNESTKNRRRKRWVKDNVKIAQDIFRDAVEATNTVLHPDVTYECSVDEPYCWQ
ncbi:hypothetical protein IV203_001625 [Nitzschia inconspicua]|uniref:Uncharacterized protein n=1 Tax=Nitzschia inconspicua TaxID=303405 RepID=A0A9K3PRE9_9STRA|nr:hypothetical protein IV203_001625 [Nitzschia inconspicua]